MAASLDRIFSEIASFSKVMGGLHNDFLGIVRRDITRFLEETSNLTTQMNWQGWTTLALTSVAGAASIAGALIPKTTPSGTHGAPSLDVRLNANDGMADSVAETLKWLGERLKDNDFLRSFCKTTAKTLSGVAPVADSWYRATTTEIESKRSLLERVNLQDGQSKKAIFDQQVQQAQTAALRILESKSKGG